MKRKATSESATVSSAAAPLGSASVATRITGWTSNLLATGIVLVAAMGLGRQLVQWWGVDAQPNGAGPLPALASGWQSADQPGWVEFGSSAHVSSADSVERTLLRGDRELALTQMREACRRILQAGDRPENSLPDASEAAFLERIDKRQPWEEKPGQWQIHQFEGTFPIVVGVAFLPPAGDASVPISGQPLAAPVRRVLAWSLATPAAADSWTIYTYRLSGSGDQTAGAESVLPLPVGSRRTLALSGNGETMIGFAGSGAAETWQRHFDAVLVERGLSGENWQLAAGVWHNRYRPARQVGSDAGTMVDIQFSAVRGAELVGLAVISQTAGQR